MYVQHLDGSSDPLDPTALSSLIDELDGANLEESDVALGEDHGWSVCAYASGVVTLVHAARPVPELVLNGVTRAEMLQIFTELATGQLDQLRGRPWVAE